MPDKFIYLCDNSLDGIFTAIYDAYEQKHGHDMNEIRIAGESYNQELFSTYIPVKTDYEKASKVARTIRQKVSGDVFEFIQMASVSYDNNKADAIYRVVILALKMGRSVMDYLTEPNVQLLMKLERHTNNEILHEMGFLRFQELTNGVLFARINPKNAILPYLAEHFSERFSGENWIIADTVHGTVMIHAVNRGCTYANMKDVDFDVMSFEYSESEELLQMLWKRFVDTIAIKERTNYDLQLQMLPLRFRKYMKEFSEKKESSV